MSNLFRSMSIMSYTLKASINVCKYYHKLNNEAKNPHPEELSLLSTDCDLWINEGSPSNVKNCWSGNELGVAGGLFEIITSFPSTDSFFCPIWNDEGWLCFVTQTLRWFISSKISPPVWEGCCQKQSATR